MLNETEIDVVEEQFDDLVGITEFANQAKGINGILKQRYSDFIVREIALNGSVSYLNSICGQDLQNALFGNGSGNKGEEVVDTSAKSDVLIETLKTLGEQVLSGLDIEALKLFLDMCDGKSDVCPPTLTAFPNLDKVTRTTVHKLLKSHFIDSLETETVQIDGISSIQLIAKHKQSKNVPNKRKRSEWPEGLGDYLRFTLLKENVDTMNAISILNQNLRCMNSTGVTYSGTKDKRGVTAQKCTVYRRKPSDFSRLNASHMLPTIFCGDFEYVNEQATLGDGGGNRFEIVLRALNTQNEADIVNVCSALHQSGFINYFGLQRFGKGGTKSHEIGKVILKSDWESCVNMLFTPKEGDRPNIALAKELYAAKDFAGAHRVMPEVMHAEKCVLQRLAAKPTDFFAAFGGVAKNARLMCAHAYQSYLWNKATSRRLKLFGMTVVPGDLVLTEPSTTGAFAAEQNVIKSSASSEGGSAAVQPRVKVVSAEDIASQRYTITDVVLPVPGYESLYPDNEIGAYYDELLAADNLSRQSYDVCHVTYREKGVYRRMIQAPKDFEWQIISYDNPDAELAVTEMSKFRVPRPPHSSTDSTVDAPVVESATCPAPIPVPEQAPAAAASGVAVSTPRFRALQVKFSLPPGTYATMLLRELTKASTESQFQAQLTKDNAVHA